ncbi:hypothetical protein LEP1GSC071_0086 [Leptospira santarosai str. JET]|nr:hypothetical protein LEP1GSC071_0086 [Leptospira santarosai str. JET]
MISSLGFFTLWEFKSYILIAFFKPGRGLRLPKSLSKNYPCGNPRVLFLR